MGYNAPMNRLTLAAALGLMCASCQTKPVKFSPLDLATLQKTEAQLQAIQMRYQSEAAPVVKEHEDLIAKYCKDAGLAVGVNCMVNSQTGDITKRPDPAPVVKR
jgi:hypothetical protein